LQVKRKVLRHLRCSFDPLGGHNRKDRKGVASGLTAEADPFWTDQLVLRMWSTESRNSERTRESRLPDFTSSSSWCNSWVTAKRRAVKDGIEAASNSPLGVFIGTPRGMAWQQAKVAARFVILPFPTARVCLPSYQPILTL
jgi:hypothetical protein